MLTAIPGAIQTAARSFRRRVNVPRWPSCLQQGGVNRLGISRLERQIDRSGILVVKKDALPFLAAVFGIENAALGIRSVGMAQCRNEKFFGIVWIDQDARDLPGIF